METLGHSVLFLLGLCAFGGLLGAWVFQKMKIPQVIGYIVIGLIVGQSGFNLITKADIEMLRPFNYFALGVIGFLVGGELRISTFKKYASQFLAILLGEGLGAFILVGIPSGIMMYIVSDNVPIAAASGIVFGAIASATDPASTIDVLWEYRAKGVLTTSVVAIVALDDALAMTLYGLGTSAAQMLTSGGADFFDEMKKVVIELGGAMLLGAVCAVILMAVLRWIKETERNLAFAIGIILLAISLSIYANMDVILATMTFGFVLINIAPRRSEELFSLMRSFSIPIYVLFFVFVGARLGISDMPKWLWGIVAIYVVGRSAGKMLGAYIGARITGADTAVKKYMGLSLFAQGGVAVGLSIMASHHLGKIPLSGELTLGDAIIFAVTATTLIVQFIGPAMVKLAIKLAGESGKNITEDDIVEEKKVKDLMDVTRDMIFESDSLQDAVSKFVEHDCIAYPVVDKEGRNVGMVSLDSFKEVLDERSSWEWILVADVMKPSDEKVGMFSPLKDALDLMKQLHLELLPVVDEDSGSLSGMLLMGNVKKRISGELLKRQSN